MKTVNTFFRLKGQTFRIRTNFMVDHTVKSLWVYVNHNYELVENKKFIRNLFLNVKPLVDIPQLAQ